MDFERMQRLLAISMSALLLFQSACFFGGATATERFARANKGIQIYIREANAIIRDLMDNNLLSPEAVIPVVQGLRSFNAAQRALIEESIKYLQVNADGKEVIVLTFEGRLRMADLAQSAFSAAQKVINDPNFFPNWSSEARARIQIALTALAGLVVQLVSLINKIKAAAPPKATVRELLPAGTKVSLLQILNLVQHGDEMLAEVGR